MPNDNDDRNPHTVRRSIAGLMLVAPILTYPAYLPTAQISSWIMSSLAALPSHLHASFFVAQGYCFRRSLLLPTSDIVSYCNCCRDCLKIWSVPAETRSEMSALPSFMNICIRRSLLCSLLLGQSSDAIG